MQDTLPIHFAPLQGYTEAIYRNAHDAFFGGVDTYYTPFVRLEKGNFRRRDVRGIEPENNGVPHLIPQLIASSAEKAEVILSLFIEKGFTVHSPYCVRGFFTVTCRAEIDGELRRERSDVLLRNGKLKRPFAVLFLCCMNRTGIP